MDFSIRLCVKIRETLYYAFAKFAAGFGDMQTALKPPRIQEEHINEFQDVLETGDIVMRKYKWYWDGVVLPGIFTHSGFVVDKWTVIHSVSEGIDKIYSRNFAYCADGIAVIKPPYKSDMEIQTALRRAYEILEMQKQMREGDKPTVRTSAYDFLLNDPEKWYCHEFSCECARMGGVNYEKRLLTRGIWPMQFSKLIYHPDDMLLNSTVKLIIT